jgi:hypothetical protein
MPHAYFWFNSANAPGFSASELELLNSAMRVLVDEHGFRPTFRWLATVKHNYHPGMSAEALTNTVLGIRQEHQMKGYGT